MIRSGFHAITVDVEDYFHTEAMSVAVKSTEWNGMPSRIEANVERLFDIFRRYSVKATFFFLGWVAERFPALVREAMLQGHEVGCHSYWHRPVFRLSPHEFYEDTLRAKTAILAATGGAELLGYRAPSFSLTSGTEWAPEILAALGFKYDSSINPIRHNFYGNPFAERGPHRLANDMLLEIPIATVRMRKQNLPIGGGAYLRVLPLMYFKWGLHRITHREGRRGMLYLHPWELDPLQPRLPVPWKAQYRQYTGLKLMQRKLESLLQEFEFFPACVVFADELSAVMPSAGSCAAGTVAC